MPERRGALIVDLPMLDAVLDGELACPPALYRMASRGTIEPRGGDAGLAGALGLEALPAAGPCAALAAGDELDGDSVWLRADPVALAPDLTAVWLRGPVALDWDSPAMQPVQDALAASFEHAGIEWHRPRTGQAGRIRLEQPTSLHFTSLNDARGRRLDEILPRGDGARRWHGLINELQMVFHQFRALSEAHGGYGLWFWGEGRLPAPPQNASPVARVLRAPGAGGDDGRARWLGAVVETMSEAVEFTPGAMLVDADPGADGAAVLAALDRQLLDPALRALARGRLATVTLVGLHRSLRVGRWSRLAAWRRAPQEIVQ